jgi:hypothetical protein
MKQRLCALLAATTFGACSSGPVLEPLSPQHPASPGAAEASSLRPSRTLDEQVMSPPKHRGVPGTVGSSVHSGMPEHRPSGNTTMPEQTGMAGHDAVNQPTASPEHPGKPIYSCPMHSDVRSDKPGTCPKCGMPLRRKPQSDEHGDMHEQ